MEEAVAPNNLAGLIRPDAPEVANAGGAGFHLIDTTMMYAPKSGGVKRYLNAKRAWLARRRPDVPGNGHRSGPAAE